MNKNEKKAKHSKKQIILKIWNIEQCWTISNFLFLFILLPFLNFSITPRIWTKRVFFCCCFVYMTTSIRSDFIWLLSYASAAVVQYFINSKEQNALTTWNMYECVHIFHVIMNMNNNRICTNTIDIDLLVFFSLSPSLHFWLKLRNETTMLHQIMTWCSVHMHKIFTYI